MTPQAKKTSRELVMGVIIPILVSTCIGVFVWYTNSVVAEQRIKQLEKDNDNVSSRLDAIQKDVSYIRGWIDSR